MIESCHLLTKESQTEVDYYTLTNSMLDCQGGPEASSWLFCLYVLRI
jgi:hypothetical protein